VERLGLPLPSALADRPLPAIVRTKIPTRASPSASPSPSRTSPSASNADSAARLELLRLVGSPPLRFGETVSPSTAGSRRAGSTARREYGAVPVSEGHRVTGHGTCGVKTNIVTGVRISDEDAAGLAVRPDREGDGGRGTVGEFVRARCTAAWRTSGRWAGAGVVFELGTGGYGGPTRGGSTTSSCGKPCTDTTTACGRTSRAHSP
jgi:hypothetical protein